MLNRHHLILIFFCLILSTSGEILPSQGTATIEMSCFDPACSTPYLLGELIKDLPELSLSRGTAIQVFAQSSDFYRTKVGDIFYDIPLSFLHITKRLFENRALVRLKLPLVNPPVYFSTPDPVGVNLSDSEQLTSLSNVSLQKQASASQQAVIQSPPPVEAAKYTEDASNRKPVSVKTSPSPASEVTQKVDGVVPPPPPPHETKTAPLPMQEIIPERTAKPKPTDIEIESSAEKFPPTSHELELEPPAVEAQTRVEDLKMTHVPDIKAQEKPVFDMSSGVTESQSLSATSDSEKTIEQLAVETTLKVKEINATPAPKVEPPSGSDSKQIKGDSLNVETPPKAEESKATSVPVVKSVEQSPVVETFSKIKENIVTSAPKIEPLVHLPSVEMAPKVNETRLTLAPKIEPPTGSDSKQIREDSIVKTPPKVGEIEVTSVPIVKSAEQSSVVEASSKVKEVTPDVKTAPESDLKQLKKRPPNVENVAPPSQTTQHSTSGEIPQKKEGVIIETKNTRAPPEAKPSETEKFFPPVQQHRQDVHPTSNPTEVGTEQPRPEATIETPCPEFKEDAMSQSPPLLDMTSESAFFHCLSFAANGSFVPSNFSSGEKSLFAGAVLFCAQHFFNAAQILLLKFPPSLVTSLDSIFTFTFKMPFVFFIAWTLFILTALVTYFAIKISNKILFHALFSSNPDDPSSRSLSQWLEMEENANLLADSLADKEEAYGRLIVWSTKVSECYKNQHRNHTSSVTRIHSQLRETKAALAECLQENKELRDTHDALVEQLSSVKTEAAVNTAHLREEIAALSKRLEEGARQYKESLAEKDRINEGVVGTLHEEVKGYQAQIDNAEMTLTELKEANQKFEEDLAARDRELLSLREAFIELKSAELKNKKKLPQVTPKLRKSDDRSSTDGWEVDDVELEAIIEEVESVQQGTTENDEAEVQYALNDFLELGRLRVALVEAEKLARAEASAREQEAKLRVELEEKMDSLKCEAVELNQKLRAVTEECEFSKTKLVVLSEYFNKREAERQKDLGRKELSQSDMSAELNALREKQRTSEVEINTLREQLSSARRELAETERANRRHVSELDKRLHENRLLTRSLENQVKDLRAENTVLRQKMFVGDRGVLPPLLAGIPPPPPPPPPPAVALASSKHPEARPISRHSEKAITSHSQIPPPPPFLPFPQIPLAGPGGSQFIPPPPPPGLIPPSLFLSQMDTNRQSPSTRDASRSGPKAGSTTSGSNQSARQPR